MVLQLTLHIILIPCSLYILASAQDTSIAQPGCVSKCGAFDIPYPFGMNAPKCYADKWFEIECRNVSNEVQRPYLKFVNLEVTYIDVSYGTIGVKNPIYHWNCKFEDDSPFAYLRESPNNAKQFVDLRGSPFVYSQNMNKFVAVGCNNTAFLVSNGTRVSDCVSICGDDKEDVCARSGIDSCDGKHCCQTPLPSYLDEYNVTIENLVKSHHVGDGCSYALVAAERESFWGWNGYSIWDFKNLKYAEAVLEWEIVNSNLKLPSASYCYNTDVSSSLKSHSGRRCRCSAGFDGNPYVHGGCHVRAPNHYHQVHGQNKSRAKWAIVGVFSSLGSIILLLGSRWLYKVVRKRIVKKRKEKYFKQNGGLLLEQRLSSGEVNVDKVKHFRLKDLEKATDNFNMNRVLGKGGQATVYKGMLIDGKIVAVKKLRVHGKVEEFINEFVILSQINHRNVVKLLGCCLETEIPLLVYEFIPNGNLFEYLHDQNEDLPMTWDMRLRMAAEVAGALFYLHSAASQPIYHRDIKSTNILLDEKYRTKIADFGASRMISIEDTHLTTVVQGTFGYLDPEYFQTSQLTEKSDVYSFGVVLIELLTGQKPICYLRQQEAKSLASYFILSLEENRLFDIIDERVAKEGDKEHIVAVANIAYRCLELNGRKRPTMKEVTIELDRIRKLKEKSNAEQNHEEIEVVAMEDFQPWAAYSTSDTGPPLSIGTPTLEVMSILI